ncbi:hypothetical protein ACFX2I_013592 [Malus domestica]
MMQLPIESMFQHLGTAITEMEKFELGRGELRYSLQKFACFYARKESLHNSKNHGCGIHINCFQTCNRVA